MKKEKDQREKKPKLRLNTETIRKLDDQSLKSVVGGFDLTEIEKTRCC